MRQPIRFAVYVMFLVVCSVAVVSAQQADNICAQIVLAALEAAQEACDATGRNQACYGNVKLEATAQDGIDEFVFEKSGDVANVAGLQTLQLYSLNAEENTWGVALMKLQASLPDDQIENVTVVLFGDVQLESDVPIETTLDMTAARGSNVRLTPAAEGRLLGSLAVGEAVLATGQYTNRAGELWFRINYGEPPQPGWVYGPNLTTEGDVSLLNVTAPAQPKLGPMQAFTFKSGVDDAPCTEAPESGLLINTPEGVGEISMLVNEVNIQLGSTVFLQSAPGETMQINNIEGNVTANGQPVPPGSYVEVPMDANSAPAGDITQPQAYNFDSLLTLPFVLLPEEIELSPAASEDTLSSLQTTGSSNDTNSAGTNSTTPGDTSGSTGNSSGGGQRVTAVDSFGLGCAGVYPSPDGGEQIACVAPGTGGTILAPGNQIYRVQFDNGVVGWVLANDLSF